MKRLSICMIVKDEEELLPRCLKSVKSIADEIIVVDTGSTDETKKIAADFGASLFDYEWSNDFSAARNESLRHAQGKWILVLDADEYISQDDIAAWNEFLDNERPLDYLAYTLPVTNFTGEGDASEEMTTAPVTRLFPNFKGIRFEKPIHEQLSRGRLGKLYHKKISLNIFHTGYQLGRVNDKKKHERNMSIFKTMKEKNDLSEYDWFTLGNQYRYAKEDSEAIRCYEKALSLKNFNAAWYSHCLIGIITLCIKHNQLRSAELWTKELSRYSNYAEYHTFKGIQYETLGFVEEAITCYLEAIRVAEARARQGEEIWLVDPKFSFEVPVQQLVELYYRLNNNQQAIYWLSKLLQKNKNHPRVLLKLVEWLCHSETQTAVISFLDKIYNVHDQGDCRLLLKIALALGQKELVQYFSKYVHSMNEMNLVDQMRFALLSDDEMMWRSLVFDGKKINMDVQLQFWVQVVIAGTHWNSPNLFLQAIAEYDKVPAWVHRVQSLFDKTSSGTKATEDYSEPFFMVAKQLFLIKDYESFDQFVSRFESAELINQLANYFYSLNLVDMAMNYYSILLSSEQLSFTGLVNVGLYQINNKKFEDGAEFLKEAVRVEPKARHLYPVLVRHALKPDREALVRTWFEHSPECESVLFVRDFVGNVQQQP